MEWQGTVRNGVIVPDDPTGLVEGMRVKIVVREPNDAKTFGERYAKYKGCAESLPEDMASQHDHYRLGTPKRSDC